MSSNNIPNKPSFWNDPDKRSLFFQVVVVAILITFFGYLFSNTLHNLETRNINTGFDFLSDVAGFSVAQTLIPFDSQSTFGDTFIVGLLNTLLVSILGIIFATIVGFLVGIARLSNNWLLSRSALVYIETFRNIPLLLQIVFWYFALLPLLPMPRGSYSLMEAIFLNNRGLSIPSPIFENGFIFVFVGLIVAIIASLIISQWAKRRQNLTGQTFPSFWVSLLLIILIPTIIYFIMDAPLSWNTPVLQGFNFKGGLTLIPELAALLISLTIYTASFIAEIVRSGIQGVSRGQSEAASALGLRKSQTLRQVVIPQAMRIIIPQLTSQYLNLAKNSSLAAAIGYPDLVSVFGGTTLNQTGQAIEILFMTMTVYLVLSLSIALLMNWYNKRMALIER